MWLQDNLMCMVSNAPKFSSIHTPILLRLVRCSVRLVSREVGVGVDDREEENVDEDGLYSILTPILTPLPT
ncbi:hypothetical protein EON65_12655, partial [archaeon]